MQILLIDESAERQDWLAERLGPHGFVALPHARLENALRDPASTASAAVVLALAGSPASAAERVRLLRQSELAQPLIVLSGRSDWRERVETLDAGADDFLLVPIRSEEVAARLRALIRRASGASGARLTVGDFSCDMKARAIWLDGQPLELTRNEFRLLQAFLLRRDCVLSRAEIAEMLYFSQPLRRSDNAVEVYVSRLRRKIGHERIRTIRGLGYRMLPHGSAPLLVSAA